MSTTTVGASRRVLSAGLVAGLAIVVSQALPAAAATFEISSGHLDVVGIVDDGASVEVGLHNETGIGDEEPDQGDLDADYEWIVGDNALSGGVWTLPATQQSGLLFPGFSYNEETGTFPVSAPDYRIELVDADLPTGGDVTGRQGSTVRFTTTTAAATPLVLLPTTAGSGNHQHTSWEFTAEGDYWLTFAAVNTTTDDEAGEVTIHFVVED